ncbi:MAG: helix-turn-helix transcriptional regulator [Clostridiales bacterium]|nr:helix-turn-helix transcriptional regulator [Clostridiales bacterium]
MRANILKGDMLKRGLTMEALAAAIGMSVSALYNKISGRSEFYVSEVFAICKAMGYTDAERDAIFFAEEVS